MGQFRKHRAACFISLLLKTETGTWHLCDYPTCWKGTRNEGNESLLLVVSAQICARSTDILHGNYPRLRGNLPLQRISSPTIIHENVTKSKTFAKFFYASFQTNFRTYFYPYIVMLHKNGYKITPFTTFCMFFHHVLHAKTRAMPSQLLFFCDVLTKIHFQSLFRCLLRYFLFHSPSLFTLYS